MMNFSEAYLRLATKLGIDAWKDYETRYLIQAAKKRFKTSYKLWDTGRSVFLERPEKVLQYYNDRKTMPSQETIEEAREHFLKIVAGAPNDTEKLRKIAAWVNKTAIYTFDKTKYGKGEYWSSPFDIWAEYKATGRFRDDCDGWAVLIWWGAVLVGIPKSNLYVWTGIARTNFKTEGGHANVIYFDGEKWFHVEGSFYPAENNKKWGEYVFSRSLRYPENWFVFNHKESYVAEW